MTRKPRINVRIYYIERGLLDMSDSIDSNVDIKIRFGIVKSSMFEQSWKTTKDVELNAPPYNNQP